MKLIDLKVIDLTPKLAEEYLGRLPVWQRDRKTTKMRLYKSLMQEGAWVGGVADIIEAILPDGTRYTNDGNHTCAAVLDTGVTIQVVLRRFAVRDADEARRLFCVIDRGGARSDNDMAKAHDFAARAGIPEGYKGQAFAAIKAISADFKSMSTAPARLGDGNALVDEAVSWSEELRTYMGWLKGASKRYGSKLISKGVMGPGLLIARHHASMGAAFFAELARDDGLRRSDPPRKVLGDWIASTPVRGNQDAYPRAVMLAWNAFFAGGKMAVLDHESVAQVKEIELAGCRSATVIPLRKAV